MSEEMKETNFASQLPVPQRMAGQASGGAYSAVTVGSPTNLLMAMLSVMNDVGYVQKEGKNEFHGYKYVTEADAIAALRPSMVKNGLILLPSCDRMPTVDEHGNTHLIVGYRLFHAPSGEVIFFNVPASGNDRSSKGTVGDKGIYKAMTGAFKYALLKTFMLETGDDPEVVSDHDRGQGKQPKGAEEQKKLDELLTFANDLMANSAKCKTDSQLAAVWKTNHAIVERLRREHPELFKTVRDAFTARKAEIKANQAVQNMAVDEASIETVLTEKGK